MELKQVNGSLWSKLWVSSRVNDFLPSPGGGHSSNFYTRVWGLGGQKCTFEGCASGILSTGMVTSHSPYYLSVVINIFQAHEKQRSWQRKCKEHLSNLPSHHDDSCCGNVTVSYTLKIFGWCKISGNLHQPAILWGKVHGMLLPS